ncbi:hypothetical protein MKMG_02181 [Methanogenium sp. MK-MG]|nr:hypothetical protein MKMG_02181 [Methanogenium sp. MK-MG]
MEGRIGETGLIHPEQVANLIELTVAAQVVGVVQADDEDHLSSDEFRRDGVGEPPDRNAGERRLMSEESPEDGGKDAKRRPDALAVDEDGDDTGGALLNLGENLPDAGGLPGSRRAVEGGVDGGRYPQGGAEEHGELPELAVTVMVSGVCRRIQRPRDL